MLIRPHDAARDDDEWRTFLRAHDFGQLIAAGRDRDVPIVVPTHFVYDGDAAVLLHLAAPNPIWAALDENPMAIMSVAGAYTYITTEWNTTPGQSTAYGVPTSYYAAVQLIGRCTVTDDAKEIAAILRAQLAHFQPEGGHAAVEPGDNPYARQFPAIRGIRLAIADVRAKFKFGGNKTPPHRAAIAQQLAARGRLFDAEARENLLRRGEPGS